MGSVDQSPRASHEALPQSARTIHLRDNSRDTIKHAPFKASPSFAQKVNNPLSKDNVRRLRNKGSPSSSEMQTAEEA